VKNVQLVIRNACIARYTSGRHVSVPAVFLLVEIILIALAC